MRISRENVLKRETHVRTLLSTTPDLSVKEVNASLAAVAEFGGHKMAPGRITAIRKSLSGSDTGAVTETTEATVTETVASAE